jgi:hypothetical protein
MHSSSEPNNPLQPIAAKTRAPAERRRWAGEMLRNACTDS